MTLDFCFDFENYVKSENNDNPHHIHWFINLFSEVITDLVRFNSDDMSPLYEAGDPECSNITMKTVVSPFLTTTPTYTHDFNKNVLHCIYPDNVNPDMDYFSKYRIVEIVDSGELSNINTIRG